MFKRILSFITMLMFMIPMESFGENCHIIANAPVFLHESDLNQCMDILGAGLDLGEDFDKMMSAYQQRLNRLIGEGTAFILTKGLSVKILSLKDFSRGLIRLPGEKVFVQSLVGGDKFWVQTEFVECR